jgi:hypothetical protein
MRAVDGALRYLLLAAGLAVGVLLFRHAMSEGLHTVIASERRPMPKVESPALTMWDGACKLDSNLQVANPLRCRMEMRAAGGDNPLVFRAKPISTMTKAESESASGWFMLAVFAIPLSLGAAAFMGFLLFRSPPAAD